MIVTIGDSVCWGQGLADVHKFDRIFAAGAELHRVAHSGAILGAATDDSTQNDYPEVPASYPSIWQQVAAVGDWADVDLVIMDGGINDVSVSRILSPWVTPHQIAQLTQQFCLGEMARLLPVVAGKLVKPGARIAVVGYFPILSPATQFENMGQAQMLMEMHGVSTGSLALGTQMDPAALVPGIVDNCMTFWKESTAGLQAAVAQTNASLGRPVSVFVDTTFTEVNSLWAPQSLLWELSVLLDAEDEVKDLRDRACDALYGDVVHLFTWGKCDRASAGHPNVSGAARIAQALKAAL